LSWKQVFEERVALLKVAAFDPKAKPLHALREAAAISVTRRGAAPLSDGR
jgi:hypothetical protein